MFLLLKNAELYTPESVGKKDILIAGGKIVAIEGQIDACLPGTVEVLDMKGDIVGPGLIDQHVHFIGGGGEGGYASRVPQLSLSELTSAGLTSAVGILGTDGITRSPKDLYAKVKGLNLEGFNAYMHTGSYEVPTRTITGNVRDDMVFIDKTLGVKIALSDHRCSFPTTEELARIVSDIRIGGMVSGKKGVLHIHMGELPDPMRQINELLEMGLPIKHFSPTHVGRADELFEAAIQFALKGGCIDLTSGGGYLSNLPDRIQQALDAGVPLQQITISSDGNGSMPKFNSAGEMVGLTSASIDANLKAIPALRVAGFGMADIYGMLSANVADSLGINKGRIEVGMDADFTAFDQECELRHVITRGKVMMRNGEVLVKGTFE